MKPGELVRLGGIPEIDKMFSNVLHARWGKIEENPNGFSGFFETGELAMVLEDSFERGGNGCRVITSRGIIGWLNRAIPQQVEGES